MPEEVVSRNIKYCPVKKGPTAFAKRIDSCQPAQSAQAGMRRNFSPS